jgi:argininosuccinate synthase
MPEGTVALAFSGGLDTTVCVPLIKEEYGYDDVIGVTVDVGQPEEEFAEATETADALGVEHYVIDATEEFADLCLDSVQANADYQGYPLGTALARPVIATAILELAEEKGCSAVAHGCTGKGNDQLRFEAVWRASDLDVLAPVRELGLTREWEMAYAEEKNLPVQGGNEGVWSIDSNLWSRSIEGGDLEKPEFVPGEEIYEWTTAPTGDTQEIEIEFEQGQAVAVDGEAMDAVDLIEHLNELAGGYGVGRTDMMEDRMLGLKVRENYEHPAATVLLNAHEALEALVMTKDELDFKHQVDREWSQKAYEGLIDAPLMDALNAFIATTQAKVTGTVTIRFEGGQARPVGRDSDYAVYSESAASFNTETVDGIAQEDATGVAKYHGFQARLANEAKQTTDTPELATDGSGDGPTEQSNGDGEGAEQGSAAHQTESGGAVDAGEDTTN